MFTSMFTIALGRNWVPELMYLLAAAYGHLAAFNEGTSLFKGSDFASPWNIQKHPETSRNTTKNMVKPHETAIEKCFSPSLEYVDIFWCWWAVANHGKSFGTCSRMAWALLYQLPSKLRSCAWSGWQSRKSRSIPCSTFFGDSGDWALRKIISSHNIVVIIIYIQISQIITTHLRNHWGKHGKTNENHMKTQWTWFWYGKSFITLALHDLHGTA